MTGALRWEEPPPPRSHRGRRSRYTDVVALLRGRPGQWAVVFEGSKGSAMSTAWQLRNGNIAAFQPVEHFEFEARASGADGQVYARYVGGAS